MGALKNLALATVFGAQDITCPEPLPVIRTAAARRLRSALGKPLIVGASVSADYFTENPAVRMLRRLGLPKPARIYAKHGYTGRRMLGSVPPGEIRRSSAVIGVDLMFWDTLYPPFGKTEAALRKLAVTCEADGIPLLLGTAPLLSFSFLQPGRARLNRFVRKLGEDFAGVRVVDLDLIYRGIQRDGGFRVGKHFYPIRCVSPDGLHLSSAACEFLAEKMLEAMAQPAKIGQAIIAA